MAKFTVVTKDKGLEAILADSTAGPGIRGTSKDGKGGYFHSDNQEGILADSNSIGAAAIAAVQLNPASTGAAYWGENKGTGPAVFGTNTATGRGAFFHSETVEGLAAETKSPSYAAIAAFQLNPTSTGAAIYAEHAASLTAGFFKGNVIVTGDISFPGADCAEDFTVKRDVLAEPGTVMALNESGELVPCSAAYERRVAGVIAGAASHRPGIIMDKQPDSSLRRQPIALVGKVFCKVDATFAPIGVGDLLTSSETEGHAMKALDSVLAFGSVIGKAMAPLRKGRGLIPILITLQ
jgi:hypothetical protein